MLNYYIKLFTKRLANQFKQRGPYSLYYFIIRPKNQILYYLGSNCYLFTFNLELIIKRWLGGIYDLG